MFGTRDTVIAAYIRDAPAASPGMDEQGLVLWSPCLSQHPGQAALIVSGGGAGAGC